VGDIHGCYAELNDLLSLASLSAEDEIIALGDIVDRGPESPRVLDFFRSQPPERARSLMGNHERKHVRSAAGELQPALSQIITRDQLGDAYAGVIEYMRGLPHWLEQPDATLVHGFFEPGVPVARQRPQVIVGTLSGEAYLREQYSQPWYELYDGDKPLIVGHHDYTRTGQPFVYRERVFCIDTGCCTGGRLTGLLLPEFRFLSAPSRANYWEQIKAEYRRTHPRSPAAEWDSAADRLLEAIYDHVIELHARILARLQSELGYDQLSNREQAKVYTAHIGEGPLASLLHLTRTGKLSLPGLRRRFKRPDKAAAFAASLGLGAEEIPR
jgi:serine/threonine protein phosphatase 1